MNPISTVFFILLRVHLMDICWFFPAVLKHICVLSFIGRGILTMTESDELKIYFEEIVSRNRLLEET